MRVRGPSFVNMQALSKMVEGSLVADVIAAIGSLDIVLGEIDDAKFYFPKKSFNLLKIYWRFYDFSTALEL